MYPHQGDFWLIDGERNREVVTDAFELFDRLNIPAGDYEFDRLRGTTNELNLKVFYTFRY